MQLAASIADRVCAVSVAAQGSKAEDAVGGEYANSTMAMPGRLSVSQQTHNLLLCPNVTVCGGHSSGMRCT